MSLSGHRLYAIASTLLLVLLWLLLAWQLAVVANKMPMSSLGDWVIASGPIAALSLSLFLLAYARTREWHLPMPWQSIGLRTFLLLLVTSVPTGAMAFWMGTRYGSLFYVLPYLLAFTAFVAVSLFSTTDPAMAVAILLMSSPVLRFMQRQIYYTDAPMSALLFPLPLPDSPYDSVDWSLLRTAPEVLFIVVILGGLVLYKARRRMVWCGTRLSNPICVFVCACLAAVIPSSSPDASLRIVIEGVVAPVVLYFIVTNAIGSRADVQKMLMAVTIGVIFIATEQLLNIYRLGGMSFDALSDAQAIGTTVRSATEFSAADVLAELYVVTTPLVLGAGLLFPSRSIMRIVSFLAALAGFVGLILSGTRGGWIAAGVELLLIALVVKRLRRPIAIGLLLSAALLMRVMGGFLSARALTTPSGELDWAIDSRFFVWRQSLELIWQNPLLGIGFGTLYDQQIVYRNYWQFTHPHSLLLDIALGGGIPAAVAFMACVFLVVRKAWRCRGNETIALAMASVVGYLTVGMASGTRLSSWTGNLLPALLIWCAFGIIMSSSSGSDREWG